MSSLKLIFANHKSCSTPGGGGALVFQVGYHPRKKNFWTHPKHIFSRHQNRICIFACFFLICHLFFSTIYDYCQKHTFFLNFRCLRTPKWNMCIDCLVWKTTLTLKYPLWNTSQHPFNNKHKASSINTRLPLTTEDYFYIHNSIKLDHFELFFCIYVFDWWA